MSRTLGVISARTEDGWKERSVRRAVERRALVRSRDAVVSVLEGVEADWKKTLGQPHWLVQDWRGVRNGWLAFVRREGSIFAVEEEGVEPCRGEFD